MARKYIMLSQGDDFDVDEKGSHAMTASSGRSPGWRVIVSMLSTSLAISLIINAILISRASSLSSTRPDNMPSQYAQLLRNVPTERLDQSDYDSVNRSVQDAAWDDRDLEPWNGFLALDEDYALSQGLPHAQRWPWDSSKGVYILVSAHELHCVRMLRVSINENHDGVPEAEQTWSYEHLLHCVNVLRESVMCNADDTPLYVGRLHKNALIETPRAGTGSMKMCRDWQALLSWSRERSACYRPVGWADGARTETDRYKYCPDGSRPWEEMDARIEG